MKITELQKDLAATFRWTARLNMNEGVANHFSACVPGSSDEILKKLFEHQARLELTCRFTWTENTICIWDNRSVIHFAIADFYPGRGLGYERIMDRIAIEGDHPK